jgi:hypothetical protein
MSGGAGIGATLSRGPACGDATVEPIKARRSNADPCASPGSDPQLKLGPLFRPATRPVSGDATREGRRASDMMVLAIVMTVVEEA